MKHKGLHVGRVAVSLGSLFATLHLAGIFLLQARVLDIWMMLHFIEMEYVVLALDWPLVLGGVVVAFLIGSIVGALFSVIYNLIARH